MIFRTMQIIALVLVWHPCLSHASGTLYVVDVPMLVCPKQGDMSQISEIYIDDAGLNMDDIYSFTFMRVSSEKVDVEFMVQDSSSPPQTIVEQKWVSLAALDGAGKATCNCTGQSSAKVEGVSDYGSSCKAWDKAECEKINGRPTGSWCCDPWCYVDKECDSGWDSQMEPDKYFSYGACDAEVPKEEDACPWPSAEEKSDDPCACKTDAATLFTDIMKEKLPADYGAKCSAHDENAKTCDTEKGFYSASQVDTWCCSDWCYVKGGKACTTAFPSINFGLEDKLYWSKIACDEDKPNARKKQIERIQTCPYKRNSDQSTLEDKKVEELCTCLGVSMPGDLRAEYDITQLSATGGGYGSMCYPWDATDCVKNWKGSSTTDAMWCCQSWCYVDEACPHANKDTRWSLGYISYKACKDEDYQKETVSSCDFSNACECTGKNDGIAAEKLAILGADYGKTCFAHDTDCQTKWGPSGLAMDNGTWDHTTAAGWCCDSWCYVDAACPIAEKSWTGAALYWNVETCDNDPTLKYKASSGKCEKSRRLLDGREKLDVAVEHEEEAKSQGSGSSERLLSARRRAGSSRRRAPTDSRRRAPPPARRRSPPPPPPSPRRRAPTAPSAPDTRRRAPDSRRRAPVAGDRRRAPAPSPPPDVRRRAPAPPPPPPAARRRAPASSPPSSSPAPAPPPSSPAISQAPSPSPPPAAARRRAPTPPPPPPDQRRRAPPPGNGDSEGFKMPAPSPAAADARRRAPPPPDAAVRRRAPAVPEDARRRAVAAEARRRSSAEGDIGGKSHGGSKSTGGSNYGYTNKADIQKNYGGKMPKKESYGYSGKKAVKKNSKVKMAMMAGAGVVAGVGAYYAYQRYKDWDASNQQSWCNRLGTFYDCDSCRSKFGNDECLQDGECFEGGCGYNVADDLNRDDLMDSAFVPALYTPPYKVTVLNIQGAELTPADLKCDKASQELAAANYSSPLSFKPLLFLTLTSMDALDDPNAPSGGGSRGNNTPPATTDGAYARSSSAVVLVTCLMMSLGLPRQSFAMISLAAFIASLAAQ